MLQYGLQIRFHYVAAERCLRLYSFKFGLGIISSGDGHTNRFVAEPRLVRAWRYSDEDDPRVLVYEVKWSPKNLDAISIGDPARRIPTSPISRLLGDAVGDERLDFLSAPGGDPRPELDGFRKAAGLHAGPPGRFANRDPRAVLGITLARDKPEAKAARVRAETS
jgi:hypothetical protein